DQHAVVAATGYVPDAIRRHLGRGLAVWRRRLLDEIGHGHVHGHIRLDVGHRQIERRIAADRLADYGRELTTGEVLGPRTTESDRPRRSSRPGCGRRVWPAP